MSTVYPQAGQSSWLSEPDLGMPVMRARWPEWASAAAWVGALTLLGVGFSFASSLVWWEYTFSYRVSMLYVTLGVMAILFLGYGRFPTAAAISLWLPAHRTGRACRAIPLRNSRFRGHI